MLYCCYAALWFSKSGKRNSDTAISTKRADIVGSRSYPINSVFSLHHGNLVQFPFSSLQTMTRLRHVVLRRPLCSTRDTRTASGIEQKFCQIADNAVLGDLAQISVHNPMSYFPDRENNGNDRLIVRPWLSRESLTRSL